MKPFTLVVCLLLVASFGGIIGYQLGHKPCVHHGIIIEMDAYGKVLYMTNTTKLPVEFPPLKMP